MSAVLTFNAKHDLVNFVSQDRYRASPDGKAFDRQDWSTPLAAYQATDGRRLATVGEGRWNAPEPEGSFTYVESTSTTSTTTFAARDDLWPCPNQAVRN